MFEFRDRAKWDAWNKRRGLSQQAAKSKYVELVETMQIGWTKQGKSNMELEGEGKQVRRMKWLVGDSRRLHTSRSDREWELQLVPWPMMASQKKSMYKDRP